MRLIDADALKKELYKFKLSDSCLEHEWALQAADDVAKYTLDAIKNAPTIDAVPVVRCKDCLYSTPTYGNNYIRCAIWGEDIKNDRYCFCGKRRTVKRDDQH